MAVFSGDTWSQVVPSPSPLSQAGEGKKSRGEAFKKKRGLSAPSCFQVRRRLFVRLDPVIRVDANAHALARIMIHARRELAAAVAVSHLVTHDAVRVAPVRRRAAALRRRVELLVLALHRHS